MIPHRYSVMNDNYDSRFSNRSTPKKLQSHTEINDKKVSVDIIYSELMSLKDRTNNSFVESNCATEKLDMDVSRVKEEISNINKQNESNKLLMTDFQKRLSNMESMMDRYNVLRENYETLKGKMDDLSNEVNILKSTRTDSVNSFENIVQSKIRESFKEIKSSLDENMNVINKLCTDNYTQNTDILSQLCQQLTLAPKSDLFDRKENSTNVRQVKQIESTQVKSSDTETPKLPQKSEPVNVLKPKGDCSEKETMKQVINNNTTQKSVKPKEKSSESKNLPKKPIEKQNTIEKNDSSVQKGVTLDLGKKEQPKFEFGLPNKPTEQNPQSKEPAKNQPSIFSSLNTTVPPPSDQPLFGNLTSSTQPVTTSTLFGTKTNVDKSQSNIFGSNTSSDKSLTNIFGNKANDEKQATTLFGNKTNDEKTTASFFGNKANLDKSSGNLFGNKAVNDKGMTNLFGNTADKAPTNLFGTPQNADKSSGNLFGNSQKNDKPASIFSNQTTTEKTPINLFGNKTTPDKSSTNIFGSNAATDKSSPSLFNANKSTDKPPATLFGNMSTMKPVSFVPSVDKSDNKSSIFGASSNANAFNFGSTTSDKTGFGNPTEVNWKGGSKLFSGAPTINKDETNNDDANEQPNVEDEEHDPHFQPIIDLPPLVQIAKDEESHEVLFKSRCKLYRFINEEWKERGVGEMKILQTKAEIDSNRPVKMVMRRDQVRKICCNQRVTKKFPTFAAMPNEKSTCWIGNDFSDGVATQEKFAIRFSNLDILTEFKNVIANVQESLSSDENQD